MRIIRACREMGLATVAVYSECDRTALHVRSPTRRARSVPSAPRESYLRIDRILDAARRTGADAVHPGYGFLAENEEFAAAVRDAGLTFIGPTPEAIALMGSKTAARQARDARRRAGRAGHARRRCRADVSDADIARVAERVGYPLLVKAVSGGGGKGMRTVADPADLAGAVRAARSEAGTAFGDSERVSRAPHRAAAPRRGPAARRSRTARSCRSSSANARFSAVTRRWSRKRHRWRSRPRFVAAMTSAAASVARAVGYTNAGTIEFLLDEDGRFYFLEMNTRLQVEHPITEMVTGVDLVRWQIRIARGERLDTRSGAAVAAARPRDRVPHLRRGSRQRFPAVAGPHRCSCARRRAPASATTAARPPGSTSRSSTTR